MENGFHPALGVALFSLLLPVGWYTLQHCSATVKRRQQFFNGWPGQVAQIFYFVALPYLAVIFGIITPSLLGLVGLEYFSLINWSSQLLLPQIQQAITLTLLAWLLDSPLAVVAGSITLLIFTVVWLGVIRCGVMVTFKKPSRLTTLYNALHWAFYRALFWSVTGNLYVGLVFGSILVILEWSLSLLAQKRWAASQQQFLVNTIILLLTSILFFYSPNLWLLIPFHLAMVAIANSKQPRRQPTLYIGPIVNSRD